MIKGVIFDMDGVLVDNRDVHLKAFAKWCAMHGIQIDNDLLLSLFGMGNERIFPMVLGDAELSTEKINLYAEQKEEIYRQMFAEHIEPLAGLRELLEQLRGADVKLAVGSSGMRKNVDFVLDKCGIGHYFDAIADGDQVRNAKPDPEVFLLAASLMGVDPSECFVFEDSFAGIAAARAAGMRVGAVATTFSRAQHSDYDILIDNFTQITSAEIVLVE